MIAVVHHGKFLTALVVGKSIGFGEFPDTLREIVIEVHLRDSADVRIARVHRDVLRVVQVAEHAHLAELRDPGEKAEADVSILGLHHAVEAPKHLAHPVLKLRTVKVVDDRLVILINQDDYLTAGLPVRGINDVLESGWI